MSEEEDDGYKVCPSCGEEYVLQMHRCASCDVDLVFPSTLPEELHEVEDELPEASELVCIRVAPISWIRAFSEALEDQGVAHRVERAMPEDAPEDQPVDLFGNVNLYGLYVEEDVAEDVRLVDEQIAALVLGPEEEEDDDDEGAEEDACPACGVALGPDDEECPDCGLAFG